LCSLCLFVATSCIHTSHKNPNSSIGRWDEATDASDELA
jgi:hypothetical protein